MTFNSVKEVKAYFEEHQHDPIVHEAIAFLLAKTNDVVPGQFVGLELTDFYCKGFFGRRYDLAGSKITDSGTDYITILDKQGMSCTATFADGWQRREMVEQIEEWTK